MKSDDSAKIALELISDAFGFTIQELNVLSLSTELLSLYKKVRGRWGDTLEYETLQFEIENLLGRELTSNEMANTLTIGDVINLVSQAKQ